jgi:hypothetical protein
MAYVRLARCVIKIARIIPELQGHLEPSQSYDIMDARIGLGKQTELGISLP